MQRPLMDQRFASMVLPRKQLAPLSTYPSPPCIFTSGPPASRPSLGPSYAQRMHSQDAVDRGFFHPPPAPRGGMPDFRRLLRVALDIASGMLFLHQREPPQSSLDLVISAHAYSGPCSFVAQLPLLCCNHKMGWWKEYCSSNCLLISTLGKLAHGGSAQLAD